jgi:hypothetical protein
MSVKNHTIYHYTTNESFRSILDSKQLWMTEAIALNDETELIHFTDTFEMMLSQGRFEFPEMEGIIRPMLYEIKPERFGIASFSSEQDCLTNWRLYGGDTTGFAIGFDAETLQTIHKRPDSRSRYDRLMEQRKTDKKRSGGIPSDIVLRDIPNVMLEHVQYDDFPRQALIDKCLSVLPPRAKIDTRILSIKFHLIRAACTLKKRSYDVEKEIRLIKNFRDYYQRDYELYDPGFLEQSYGHRAVHGSRRLFYKHDFRVEQVNEVMLGRNCATDEVAVREMLREFGFPNDVSIKRSAHRYRTASQT